MTDPEVAKLLMIEIDQTKGDYQLKDSRLPFEFHELHQAMLYLEESGWLRNFTDGLDPGNAFCDGLNAAGMNELRRILEDTGYARFKKWLKETGKTMTPQMIFELFRHNAS